MREDMKLVLAKQEEFLGVKCDFYKDEDDNVYMTREQIGGALEYSNARVAITKIHSRNKDRLDQFSVSTKLVSTDGKPYETVLYTEKGIYEICRFSKQPLTNDFYDWVYDQVIIMRKTGGAIVDTSMFLERYFSEATEEQKLFMESSMKTIDAYQEKITEMTPKAENWSTYMDAKGNLTMAKVAKSLDIKGIGRNKLIELLRDKGVLRFNNEPYQTYVDREYFTIVSVPKNGRKFSQTLVTGKGLEWLGKKMKEWGYMASAS